MYRINIISFHDASTIRTVQIRSFDFAPMTSILPLLLFVAVATVTPGGATTLAITSGARFGFVRSIPLMLGIAMGLALLAALGLGGLLLTLPSLQTAVRALGSAYLLWLAWRIARSGPPNANNGPARPVSLVNGFLLLWLNPKGWAMTVGAAASSDAANLDDLDRVAVAVRNEKRLVDISVSRAGFTKHIDGAKTRRKELL
ncbi:hypothetical protein OKW26_000766 [Paraburkholderia sp. 32]